MIPFFTFRISRRIHRFGFNRRDSTFRQWNHRCSQKSKFPERTFATLFFPVSFLYPLGKYHNEIIRISSAGDRHQSAPTPEMVLGKFLLSFWGNFRHLWKEAIFKYRQQFKYISYTVYPPITRGIFHFSMFLPQKKLSFFDFFQQQEQGMPLGMPQAFMFHLPGLPSQGMRKHGTHTFTGPGNGK